jgi:hypothetical protein
MDRVLVPWFLIKYYVHLLDCVYSYTCTRYTLCVFTYVPPVALLTSVFCCKV